MEMNEIPEPIGKTIIDSGLGEMTSNGLYVQYTDVITLMKKYSQSQLEALKKENEELKAQIEKCEFVNIYQDEHGYFISDSTYTSFESAFQNRDKLSTYIRTDKFIKAKPTNENWRPKIVNKKFKTDGN